MKVDIKDYELMKDMAYDSREKFQMLHAKMLLIKEGESTLKEMYYDLVEKYQRKKQECEKLKSENFAFEGLVKTQDNLIDDLQNKNDSIQNIADDLQRRNHDLTQMLETKEKELEKAKELNHCMSGQMDFIKFELELKLSAEIKNKNCVIEELKSVDKQKDKWREEAEKLRNTLNEIKKKCSKYQTCIIVLKKDILNIINKEKETK